MKTFAEDIKITELSNGEGAATGTIDSTTVDMTGYDGCIFLVRYGTAAVDNLIHVEQSADDSSWTDTKDSEPNDAAANTGIQYADVVQPPTRYLRVVAVRGTSSTIDYIIAQRYRLRSTKGVTNKIPGTIEGETLIAPIAGTK